MAKDIQIKYKLIRVPETIMIDGVTYPNHRRNFDVVAEYERAQDESVLDKLVEFSIVF